MYVTSLPHTYTYVCTHKAHRESRSSYSSRYGRVGPGIYPAKGHVQVRCSKNKQLAANHCTSGPEANRIHGFTSDKAPIRQPAICIVEETGTVYHTVHIRQLCGKLILCTRLHSQFEQGRDQYLKIDTIVQISRQSDHNR